MVRLRVQLQMERAAPLPAICSFAANARGASLRYLDTFVKVDSARLFAERLLYVDWINERALP
jgi:hypothetical protein